MTDATRILPPKRCITCGAELSNHVKFCDECGSAVYRPESDEGQPPEPAPAESQVPEASSDEADAADRQGSGSRRQA